MYKIFYVIFYVITATIIGLFFIKEKKITNKLNEISDSVVDKFKIKKINPDIILGINILLIIMIASTYIFFMDKSYSYILPLKRPVMFLVIAINIVLLAINKKKEIVFLLDLVMFVAADDFFGIYDLYFKYVMLITAVAVLVSIILDVENLKEKSRTIINAIFVLCLVYILQNHYLGNYNIPTQSMETTILAGDRIFSNNMVYKFSKPKLNDIISFVEPLENKVMYTKRITGLPGTVFDIQDAKITNNGVKISDRNYSYGKNSIYELILAPIYIPKKGDKVKIYKILEFDYENSKLNIISKEEFYQKYSNENYVELFGVFNNTKLNKRYTYLMTVEGRNEILLPILDFKYSKNKMNKLLRGEALELTQDYYMAMGDNTENSQDTRYFGYISASRIKGRLFFRWYPFDRIGIVRDEF